MHYLKDKVLYLQMMFDRSVDTYKAIKNKNSLSFFDRGIPDSLTYAKIIGFEKTNVMEHHASHYRYNQAIFFLSPWRRFIQWMMKENSWEEAVVSSELNAEI